MKKLLVLALFIGVCGLASAAELTVNPDPKPASGGTHAVRLPNITQNNDAATITALASVSCNAGGLHADNSYWRRFLLATDHGIALQYNVTSIDFGVENAVGAGGTQPISVNLHSIGNGATFLLANLTSIGSTSTTIADQALTIANVGVTGSIVNPATTDLVVEIFTPDGQTAGHSFFIGANGAGDIRPAYLSAAACGITEPTTVDAIGFPGMDIVMTVNGDEIGQPTATPDPGAGGIPVPTLSRWGMVAMLVLLAGAAVLLISRRS